MFIYKDKITIEEGKRSGKPCIRHMRITVEDILRWLASGMSFDDILVDFPELTQQDLRQRWNFRRYASIALSRLHEGIDRPKYFPPYSTSNRIVIWVFNTY